ncbi:hypothetical protein EXIGLDRAFT_738626 [Exidia glandulosa HHB12029]|uniref:Uncharacterized protein n=1 Tax=Exidia glandulosa HHB12029 TaxID=1314781 RepID=A0A165NNX3_EXIGL|nr:hypothetical protein EXIGLDRAFT_738626 [Exidia glandulosa HHB12029]
MKFTTASMLLATAAVASAVPAPVTGARLRELQDRHAEVETKRQAQGLIALSVGVWLAIAGESAGETLAGDVAQALSAAFGQDDTPWSTDGNCQAKFSTQGGANCKLSTSAAEKSGNSTGDANTHDNNWNVCPWIDPQNNDPPVQYFTDPGIGDYSVQFTATDEYTFAGIDNTQKCVAEGLCNPRFTFFRTGYSIVLDTWLSQGDVTEGEYSGDFHGLCGNGPIKDQFSTGGDVIGYDCAIPCWNDADLPSTST